MSRLSELLFEATEAQQHHFENSKCQEASLQSVLEELGSL